MTNQINNGTLNQYREIDQYNNIISPRMLSEGRTGILQTLKKNHHTAILEKYIITERDPSVTVQVLHPCFTVK
jgi:hypothetical protein